MLRSIFILIVYTVFDYGQAGSLSELKIGSSGGGNRFGLSFPETYVHKLIGLSGDEHVEQIAIGDKIHPGIAYIGTIDQKISLENDEYISSVTYKTSDQVDYLKFCTNKNRCVAAGGTNVTYVQVIDNIRVLAISCKANQYIYNLGIMYIPMYWPSQSVSKNVSLILAHSPPSSEVEEYTADADRVTDSYIKTIEYMARMNFDTIIEGEYIVKIHSQFGFRKTHPNLQDYKKILKRELKQESKNQSIPQGYVGVLLANGELLKGRWGRPGTFWMMPTSVPTFSVIKLSEVKNLLGYYDLTGDLFKQMPDLKQYKTTKNGHIYYGYSSKQVTVSPLDMVYAVN